MLLYIVYRYLEGKSVENLAFMFSLYSSAICIVSNYMNVRLSASRTLRINVSFFNRVTICSV